VVMMQNGDQVPRNEGLEAECAQLRHSSQLQQEQLKEAAAENARLRKEFQTLKVERDQYLAALYSYLKKGVIFDEAVWAAEYAEAKQSGRDFGDLVREVEVILDRGRSEGRHAG